jgi:tRNA threonylcarbamoyladenosine biosynthesis protein TsaE
MATETFTTGSPEQTLALGRQLARRLGAGDCVALEGELGSGKTVLVRGIAGGLGVGDERQVCSPSYVLVREYAGRVPIYHVDLYRLSAAPAELGDLALEEMLADGVVLIEWADRARGALPRPHWRVAARHAGPAAREFSIQRVE